jgi:sucrose-6-phosphate hydrolase SacC (GH32 family)
LLTTDLKKEVNMKKFIYILTVQAFLLATAMGQTDWDKYQGNPIVELGPAGSWDSKGIDMGSVVFDGTLYHLYYGGSNGTSFRIGHATSQDGVSWSKDPLNPILDIGPIGSWDHGFVYLPNVLLNGTTFHMWYDGFGGTYEQIGHATSEDGSTWIKDPLNPVVEVGPPSSWDDKEIFTLAGSVIFEENVYKMWYGGVSFTTMKYNIGYATSTDGSIWTKDTINNPVLQADPSSEWEGSHVVPGSVLNDGSIYRMWYSGCGDDLRYQIGLATSTDGIAWTKDTVNNPVLTYGSPGSWDYIRIVGCRLSIVDG